MTEIWVPYGPVEVSFDIKQENLSQVLESQPKKISKEEIEQKAMESAGPDCILVLSGTNGTAQVLDALLLKNKGITKLLHTKQSGSLARRKAQEYHIPTVEQVNTQDLADIGPLDGAAARMISQVKNSSNLTVLTSVHYDPLFGLSSAASDLMSLSQETKCEAFKRSFEEIPCEPSRSNASWYATRVLQTCPNVNAIEVVETSTAGALALFSGEPEAVHAKVLDFWKTNLTIELPSRA
ncbi:MAG: hypothetical protein PXY39_07970, partial [archaeon]|nr:hypothetical protein [archaeon]